MEGHCWHAPSGKRQQIGGLSFLGHAWPFLNLQADSRTRVRNGGAPLRPPRHLYNDFPKHVTRNVSRFRLRAHTLAVEPSIWRSGNGHCGKCSCVAVQNEVHVLFHCQDLFQTSCVLSQGEYLFLFFPFCPFLWRPPMFCIPCLVRLSSGFKREKKRKEKPLRQWHHSLHQLRKRRHIGPKSHESPPPGRMRN